VKLFVLKCCYHNEIATSRMSEVNILDHEIKETISSLQVRVASISRAQTLAEKKELEVSARPTIKELRAKLTLLRVESKHIPDSTQKSMYEVQLRNYEDVVKDLERQIRTQINPPPKSLAEQHAEELMGEGGVNGSGFRNTDQVLRAGVRIQNDALESLRRSERLASESESIGRRLL
jgi:tyrosine-protein phosphatase YwqE